MADNTEQDKQTDIEYKENIWTDGPLSILGRPVQLWRDEMKHASTKADEMLKVLPCGFLDNPSLSTRDKYGLSLITGVVPAILGGLAGLAALNAGAVLIPLVLIPTFSACVGLSVTAEILGRKSLKENVTAEKKSALITTGATILSLGAAAISGMGIIPVVGIGLAVYAGLGGPKSVAKSASLVINAVTSLPNAVFLGGTSGAAKSVQSSKEKITTGWKKLRSLKPLENMSKKMAHKKQDVIAELQNQVSVLTQKVADLENAFAQSAAKPVVAETKVMPKPASKKTPINNKK